MIKIIRNVYDGARANCLFNIYIGTTCIFVKRLWSKKKYGIFTLYLFNPYVGKVILNTKRRSKNGKKIGKIYEIWRGNGKDILSIYKTGIEIDDSFKIKGNIYTIVRKRIHENHEAFQMEKDNLPFTEAFYVFPSNSYLCESNKIKGKNFEFNKSIKKKPDGWIESQLWWKSITSGYSRNRIKILQEEKDRRIAAKTWSIE